MRHSSSSLLAGKFLKVNSAIPSMSSSCSVISASPAIVLLENTEEAVLLTTRLILSPVGVLAELRSSSDDCSKGFLITGVSLATSLQSFKGEVNTESRSELTLSGVVAGTKGER